MTKNKIQRLLAILCAVAAAFCMVLGFINMPKQNGAAGQEILRTMRIQTLLSATGDSVVESYVHCETGSTGGSQGIRRRYGSYP